MLTEFLLGPKNQTEVRTSKVYPKETYTIVVGGGCSVHCHQLQHDRCRLSDELKLEPAADYSTTYDRCTPFSVDCAEEASKFPKYKHAYSLYEPTPPSAVVVPPWMTDQTGLQARVEQLTSMVAALTATVTALSTQVAAFTDLQRKKE